MNSKNVYCLFLYAFCSAAAYVVGRAVADGLFISSVGPAGVPVMHVASAGVMSLLALGYSRLARFIRVESLARVTSMILAISSFGGRLFLERMPDDYWTLAALYVLAEVRGGMGSIMLATLMNERIRSDQAKQSFGFVGAGATLAGIVFGVVVGWSASQIHASNLLYVGGVIELLGIVPISLTARTQDGTVTGFGRKPSSNRSKRIRAKSLRRPRKRGWKALLHSRFVLLLALATALQTAIALCVEFQWKSTLSQRYGNADALTTFFGTFYASVYLLTGILQLRFTGWFLKTCGHLSGLLMFPGMLLAVVGSMLIFPHGTLAIWGTTLAKGCDTLKRSCHDPAVQLLYSPLPTAKRRRLITFVTGIVKPVSEAIAATLLLQFVSTLQGKALSLITLALIVGWISSVSGMYRLHSSSINK